MHWQRVPGATGPRTVLLVLSLGLSSLAGCGSCADPATHEVKGKVEFTGGDVKQLAGGRVEAFLVGDLRVEASGEIQPDGSFSLGTPHDGHILDGAREGEYQVRIVLSDEDPGSRQRRGPRLAPRFRRVQTSGLSFGVPDAGPVLLRVSTR
jgi:hypothetical protein